MARKAGIIPGKGKQMPRLINQLTY